MKKLFTLSAIVITACILFTSCSKQTSLTLTKRLYRKGYYVNFGIAENNVHQATNTKMAPISRLTPITSANIDLANIDNDYYLQMLPEEYNEVTEIVSESQSVKPSHIAKLIDKAKKINTNLSNDAQNFQLVHHNTASKNAQKGNTDKLYDEEDILILLLCIFLPPIGVFLLRGLAIEFWLDLLLTCLLFLPGMIYAIIVFLE